MHSTAQKQAQQHQINSPIINPQRKTPLPRNPQTPRQAELSTRGTKTLPTEDALPHIATLHRDSRDVTRLRFRARRARSGTAARRRGRLGVQAYGR